MTIAEFIVSYTKRDAPAEGVYDMKLVYTDGTNADFIALCALLDGYLNEIAGGEVNRKQYIPHNVAEDIQDVFLAYDGADPIGCAAFKPYGEGAAEVKRVFVKEAYRGRGISKRLMNLLEKKALKKGYLRLILETGESLVSAMGLYRSAGFRVIQNYGPYKDMPESVCMEKRLER